MHMNAKRPTKPNKPNVRPAVPQKRPGRPAKPRRPSTLGRKFPAEPLTRDEVKRILAACSNRSATGIRARALIVTFYRAGLRVKEALSLLPKDFDPAAGTIRVLHGKGDKCRIVGIDAEAIAIISRWLDKRAALGFNGRHPIYCTLRGRPIQSVFVRNLLKRLARRAGIEKRSNPHSLRHSCAFELANEGTPVHVIQMVLGHTSLATTDRYIRHLNPMAAIDAMRGRTGW